MISMTVAEFHDAFERMGYPAPLRSQMIEQLQRWQNVFRIPTKPATPAQIAATRGWTAGTQKNWEFIPGTSVIRSKRTR